MRLVLRLACCAGALVTLALAPSLASSAGAPSGSGTRVERFTLHSALLRRGLSEILVEPAGAHADRSRPLLVLLHGRGGRPASWLAPGLFAGLRNGGVRAPDVLLVNGGDHSYYHDRADGPWGAYVIREAIPAALKRSGADPARLAIGGISMGGFGAFDLARLNRGRFCAVGGHSAALWQSWGDTAPGAFDDGADFARHDVVAAARRNRRLYGSARIWLDGGLDDPFRTVDEALAAALITPSGGAVIHHWPGSHNTGYWDAHMERYLGFYTSALAARSCHGGYHAPVAAPTGPSGPTGPHGAAGSGHAGPGAGGAAPGGA